MMNRCGSTILREEGRVDIKPAIGKGVNKICGNFEAKGDGD